MIHNRKQIKEELKSKNYNANEQYVYKLMRYDYRIDITTSCIVSKNNNCLVVELKDIKNFLKDYFPEYII